jgi:hypothetical protein
MNTANNSILIIIPSQPAGIGYSASGLPIVAMFGFVPGLMMGLKKG